MTCCEDTEERIVVLERETSVYRLAFRALLAPTLVAIVSAVFMSYVL